MNSQRSDWTPEAFVNRIEGYYAKMPPYRRDVVLAYLQREKFPADYLRRLWDHMVYAFSTEYKNVPDVAVLERMCRELDKQPRDYTPPAALIEADPGVVQDMREEVATLMADLVERMKQDLKEREV